MIAALRQLGRAAEAAGSFRPAGILGPHRRKTIKRGIR
jgi:hypothetical protein